MNDISEYLSKTESAVAHVFHGIEDLVMPLRTLRNPMLVGIGDPEDCLEQWLAENGAEIARSLEIQRKYVAELTAIETLCGGILQMAYHAIAHCSGNLVMPDNLTGIVKAKVGREQLAPFAVGRAVCGLPLGLVVYVGRNQYAHHDEPELRATNAALLQYMLAHREPRDLLHLRADEQTLRDGAEPRNLAKAFVDTLRWRTYEDYRKDLIACLGNV